MHNTAITQLCKVQNGCIWRVVSNPSILDLKNTQPFLTNSFNDYLEYHNCGITYRFVRNQDLHKYGIREETIDISPVPTKPISC